MTSRRQRRGAAIAVAACAALLPGCTGRTTPTGPPARATPTPTATATPTTTAAATPTSTPTPAPTPTPQPTPVISSIRLQQNLVAKKNRTGEPPAYTPYTPAEFRALPLLGPDHTEDEFAEMLRLEERAVRVEGELVRTYPIADGDSYGRLAAMGDWHVELRESSDLSLDATRHLLVVTEMTPPYQEAHPAWNGTLLRSLARYEADEQIHPAGARVRVYGWLLNDIDHEDIVPARRGTSWEIHPVTRFEYFDGTTWVRVE